MQECSVNRIAADSKSAGSPALVTALFSPEVEKIFSFTFMSQKDGDHIRRGFERSLLSFIDAEVLSKVARNKSTQLLILFTKNFRFRICPTIP